MSDMHIAGGVQSLAATTPGETIQVQRILFDSLRSHCALLGIQQGDVVRYRAGTSARLWIVTAQGRLVGLEREWARFIQVAPSQQVDEGERPRQNCI